MADRVIFIQVDPYTREFRYRDEKSNDRSNLSVGNGDRLVWVLDASFAERTFQIDFEYLNPFQPGRAVSFRGNDFVVSSSIYLPPTYNLNKRFKYAVSLGNGWRDHHSPLCQHVSPPPPPDLLYLDTVSDASFLISWTDANENKIVLAPTYAKVKASFGTPAVGYRATVSWQWDTGQPDTQPFELSFINPPPGWPNAAIRDPECIVLSLPPGQAKEDPDNLVIFKILTTSADQTSTDVNTNGTLVVYEP